MTARQQQLGWILLPLFSPGPSDHVVHQLVKTLLHCGDPCPVYVVKLFLLLLFTRFCGVAVGVVVLRAGVVGSCWW